MSGAGYLWERGHAYALRGWGDVGGGYRGIRRVGRAYVLDVESHESAVDVVTVLDADTGWVGALSHVEVTDYATEPGRSASWQPDHDCARSHCNDMKVRVFMHGLSDVQSRHFDEMAQ